MSEEARKINTVIHLEKKETGTCEVNHLYDDGSETHWKFMTANQIPRFLRDLGVSQERILVVMKSLDEHGVSLAFQPEDPSQE